MKHQKKKYSAQNSTQNSTLGSPLEAAARFYVDSTKTSHLTSEARKKKMLATRSGKAMYVLYAMRGLGAIIYSAGAIIVTPKLCFYDDKVVEDHANRLIAKLLKRVVSIQLEEKVRFRKPKRTALFSVWLSNLRVLMQAYKRAELQYFSEYARILTLFRYYIVWKTLFLAEKPKASLFVRTNDQKRTALAVVSQEFNVPAAAFTIDMIRIRPPAPYAVGTQFCWTTVQKADLERQGIRAVMMPVPELQDISLDLPPRAQADCGLLLNAKCDVEKVKEFVHTLQDEYSFNRILVRPHPGFKTEKLQLNGAAEMCDWQDPLKSFFDDVHVVFALNTNAVIDALLHGVPVVYVGNLDALNYDLHGFVRDGIVLPFSADFSYPQTIRDFYSSQDFAETWNTEIFSTDASETFEVLKEFGIRV